MDIELSDTAIPELIKQLETMTGYDTVKFGYKSSVKLRLAALDVVQKKPHLRHLSFQFFIFSTVDFKHFFSKFDHFFLKGPLMTLSLESIESEEVAEWVKTLAQNTTLRALKLVGLNIDEEILKTFCNSETLERLDLQNFGNKVIIKPDSIALSVLDLIRKNKIQSLSVMISSLFTNPINTEKVTKIERALQWNTRLETLNIGGLISSLNGTILNRNRQKKRGYVLMPSFSGLPRSPSPEEQKKAQELDVIDFTAAIIVKETENLEVSETRKALDAIGYNPNVLSMTSAVNFLVNTSINLHIANEHYTYIVRIIKAYQDILDPNLRDFNGATAFIMSAKVYSADSVTDALLTQLPRKLDINAVDKQGRSGLHYLFCFGKQNLARLAITEGADPSIRDLTERMPSDYTQLAHAREEIAEMHAAVFIHPQRDKHAVRNALMGYHFFPSDPGSYDSYIVNQEDYAQMAKRALSGETETNQETFFLRFFCNYPSFREQVVKKSTNDKVDSKSTAEVDAIEKFCSDNAETLHLSFQNTGKLKGLFNTQFPQYVSLIEKRGLFERLYQVLYNDLAGKSVTEACIEDNKSMGGVLTWYADQLEQGLSPFIPKQSVERQTDASDLVIDYLVKIPK